MKKIISVFLVFVMIFSFACIPASAEDENENLPVVMISGFGATTLVRDGEVVFPPSTDTIMELLGKYGIDIGSGLVSFIATNKLAKIAPSLIAMVNEIIEPIRMNEDGTSYYDLEPVVSGAENTSYAAFKANDMLDYVPYTGSDFLDMEMIADKVGDDRVFNFTYDWRMSNYDLSEQLLDYIEDVLALTGAEKVNVYSISQGSLLMGEYLYRFGEKGYINNCVMDTPLLGGSDLVSDIVSYNLNLDYAEILELLACILHTETDLTSLASLLSGERIQFAVSYGAENIIVPAVLYSAAFWEMLPVDETDSFIDSLLDEEASADMIAKVKLVQNGFMSHISETLRGVSEYGTTVSIKACYGHDLATGNQINSDGIVNTEYSCGAICAPYGETFSDDYVQADSSLPYSVSPDRTVDISAGYYPERTWLFSDLYHGQVEWDKQSLALVEHLLYDNNTADAYSSAEYPQFMSTEAPNEDLSIRFACTNSQFLACNDGVPVSTGLIIKNVSSDALIITSVRSGIVSSDEVIYLKSGESTTITVDGTFDCPVYDTLTIEYATAGKMSDKLTKDFGITVLDNYGGQVIENPVCPSSDGGFIGMLIKFIYRIVSFIKNIF